MSWVYSLYLGWWRDWLFGLILLQSPYWSAVTIGVAVLPPSPTLGTPLVAVAVPLTWPLQVALSSHPNSNGRVLLISNHLALNCELPISLTLTDWDIVSLCLINMHFAHGHYVAIEHVYVVAQTFRISLWDYLWFELMIWIADLCDLNWFVWFELMIWCCCDVCAFAPTHCTMSLFDGPSPILLWFCCFVWGSPFVR